MSKPQDYIDVKAVNVRDSSKVEVEVVLDADGKEVVPISFIENIVEINGYNDLCVKINALNIDDDQHYVDGRTFDQSLSQSIWKHEVFVSKPVIPKTEEQRNYLYKIYKFVYYCTQKGQYPLMRSLCNYLGTSVESLMMSVGDVNDPMREINTWIYNLMEACAQSNSLKSNGSQASRKWLDESREYKVSAETEIAMATEQRKIDMVEKLGHDIFNDLLGDE